MALVDYTPTAWTEGAATPGISALQLDRIEAGINDLALGVWNASGQITAEPLIIAGQTKHRSVTEGVIVRLERVDADGTDAMTIGFYRGATFGTLTRVARVGMVATVSNPDLTVQAEEAGGRVLLRTPLGVALTADADTVVVTNDGDSARQVRNIHYSTANPTGGEGVDGDVWFRIV